MKRTPAVPSRYLLTCLLAGLPAGASVSCTAVAPPGAVQDTAKQERGAAKRGWADPLANLERYADDYDVRVRRRPSTEHDLAQPAQVSAIKATGTANSQTIIDAGMNWAPGFLQVVDGVDFSLLAEMHKNTALRQKQEAYQFGVMAEKTFSERSVSNLHVHSTVALKTDKYTDYGLFSTLRAAFLRNEWGAGEMVKFGDHGFRWLPQAGVNLEVAKKVFPNNLIGRGRSGTSLSFVATLGAEFYPEHAALDGRVWLYTEATYWGQVVESGGFERTSDKEHLFRGVLNYALTEQRNIVASLEFGAGGNPEVGRRPEDYFQFNLGFQLGGSEH